MQIIEVKTMRQKIQFLNGKGRILELEKYFIKRQRTKAKRERKKIFFKPIIVPIDDMDRFEEKEIKKKRHIKNTWYD